MSYYVLLTFAALMVLALSGALWKTTHSIAFLFGMAALYFWSLHGAWAIVTDCVGGDSQKHYHYLYDKMFPVFLDEYYTWTLVMYATFILIVGLTTLLSVRPAPLVSENLEPVVLSHDRIIVTCGIAAFISFIMMRESLESAFDSGKSAYSVTRLETDNLDSFHIHQMLNRIALAPAALGLATLLSSGRCRYLAGVRRLRHYLGYAALLSSMFCFCVVLGNKNELSLALFSGCFFYLANSTRPRTTQLATCGAVLLACVGFIDFARAFSIDEISNHVSFGEIVYSLVRLADSNEAFAAHMSLYGVMSCDVPLTYGSSVYIFLASAIPSMLWPDRPENIYWYYEHSVGLVHIADGQGYTIHHATGWYLNFGFPGVIFGACLVGRVWAALYNNLARGALRQGATAWRIFCIIGFFTFSANLPTLIRSGPEGYKGILVDSFLIPVAILFLSRSQQHKSFQTKMASRNYSPGQAAPSHCQLDRTAFGETTALQRRRTELADISKLHSGGQSTGTCAFFT